jgi:predicted outer membrane repeat protein
MLFGFVALLAAATAQAATMITVTSLNDPSDKGFCTLRDAIVVAQGGTVSPDVCTTSGTGSPYSIIFSVSGTITVSVGAGPLPPINSPANLTITGPNPASSSGITIDGGGKLRFLLVRNGAVVSLQYLTVSNGSLLAAEGGAVGSGGMLTITDCTFSNNQAGEGGAILNDEGTLIIAGSTFSDNTAQAAQPAGGAIYNNGGAVTITNSTFSGNQAAAASGSAFGGAIANVSTSDTATLNLANVTFLGNQATGDSGLFGGAISNGGIVNIKGTILASSNAPDNCFSVGTFNDDGYNIADDSSCNFTATTSQVITSTSAIGLASGLGMNGGPTETIAVTQVTGGAYNFIPADDCTDLSSTPQQLTIDQRGDTRPVNGTCSAGAYQFVSPIDCSTASASTPNLTGLLPFYFMPEYVFGVNNQVRAYNLQITGVTQDKRPTGLPLCPNAFWSGTTTYVRTNNEPLQPGPSGLLYQIQFKATDVNSGVSCTGAVPVCVQGLFHSGQQCLAPLELSYDATKCP